jgi:glutamate-ammonia-ligase adenylyltransferase
LRARIEAEIAARLGAPRDHARILADARDMREKITIQYPGRNRWDLKYAPGGLIDIEFLAQSFQLIHASGRPDILDTNTVRALEKIAAAGLVSAGDTEVLLGAARLQTSLTQILRIALEEALEPATASAGLKALLVHAGGAVNFTKLEQELAACQDEAHAVFHRLMAG